MSARRFIASYTIPSLGFVAVDGVEGFLKDVKSFAELRLVDTKGWAQFHRSATGSDGPEHHQAVLDGVFDDFPRRWRERRVSPVVRSSYWRLMEAAVELRHWFFQ